MPKSHAVAAGDCIASIAQANGFADYKRIFDDDANRALRQERPNPNVLSEGDVVVIPDPLPKTVTLEAGTTHEFVLAGVKTLVRLDLFDDRGEALSGWDYELTVGNRTYADTIPLSGRIEHPLSATETTGTLHLWFKKEEGIDGYLLPLEIGSLEHESADRACAARLANLGFGDGAAASDGDSHEALDAAVRAFQKKMGLAVTGKLDSATREQLRIAHEGR